MPPFRRSRGGCATCKRRKRKCDEARPSCAACQAKGIACGGYDIQLRWDSDRSSRCRSSAPETPEDEHGAPLPGAASTYNDWSTPAGASATTVPASLHTSTEPCSAQPPNFDMSVSESERIMFAKFLEYGVHYIYSTTIHGWVKPLIAENSQYSNALLIICATIQIYVDGGPSVQYHQNFDRCLRAFQLEISRCAGVIRGSTVGAGLLLCTLSLLQGLPWTVHLLCMADLYNLHGDLHNLRPKLDPYTHHCLEVMGVMDMPTFVLGRTTPRLSFWRRFREAQRRWESATQDGIEPVSGLPRTLLDVFAQIEEPDAEMRFWLWPGENGELMQVHLWDAWRFAGILDHRRRNAQGTVQIHGVTTAVTLPTTEQLLCRLLASLDALRLGMERPEYSHLLVANGTFYPYVMASLEFQILHSRPLWKRGLDRVHDKFLSDDRSQNCQVLLEALSSSWQRGDTSLDLDEAMRKKGVEIALF